MAKKASNEQAQPEEMAVDNAPPPTASSSWQGRTDQPTMFNTLAWLMEGATGMLSELRRPELGLPAQFWTHAHAARKEGLLALRTLLDEAIARSDEKVEKAQAQEQRRERRGGINIEF